MSETDLNRRLLDFYRNHIIALWIAVLFLLAAVALILLLGTLLIYVIGIKDSRLLEESQNQTETPVSVVLVPRISPTAPLLELSPTLPPEPSSPTLTEGLPPRPTLSPTALPPPSTVQALPSRPPVITLTPSAIQPPHRWAVGEDVYVKNGYGTLLYLDRIGTGKSIWFDYTYIFLVTSPPVFDAVSGEWWWPVCTRQGSSPLGEMTRGWVKNADLEDNLNPHFLVC